MAGATPPRLSAASEQFVKRNLRMIQPRRLAKSTIPRAVSESGSPQTHPENKTSWCPTRGLYGFKVDSVQPFRNVGSMQSRCIFWAMFPQLAETTSVNTTTCPPTGNWSNSFRGGGGDSAHDQIPGAQRTCGESHSLCAGPAIRGGCGGCADRMGGQLPDQCVRERFLPKPPSPPNWLTCAVAGL